MPEKWKVRSGWTQHKNKSAPSPSRQRHAHNLATAWPNLPKFAPIVGERQPPDYLPHWRRIPSTATVVLLRQPNHHHRKYKLLAPSVSGEYGRPSAATVAMNHQRLSIKISVPIIYRTYVSYLTYSTFVPVIKWPRCEKLLKNSNYKLVWEKWFDFSQPKSKSKPMTLFSGTRVSKRDQILCHILWSAIRDLLLFTFGRHLNCPLTWRNLVQATLTISCLCSPIAKNPAYRYTGATPGVAIRQIFGNRAT